MADRTKRTLKKRDRFIKALADSANITEACEFAGLTRSHAYTMREQDPEFAAEWESAIETAVDKMEKECARRAFNGVMEPVFYQGQECGVIPRYSDTLAIFLLKAHRPERFRERYDIKSDNKHTHKKVDEMTDAELDEIIERSADK